jgi:manganese-dependent ADP-ribose/CDP-alcohol diphosphatase
MGNSHARNLIALAATGISLGPMNRRLFMGLAAGLPFSAARAAESVAGGEPLLSFGLITDLQFADVPPAGERHYRESPEKLKAAIAWLAEKNLPFTLHLGDLIDRDFESFDQILPLFEALGHPVHHLLGNHDYEVAEAQKQGVARKLGMPADYYSFSRSRVRFVMLDTNEVSLYKHPAGSPESLAAEKILLALQARKAPGGKKWNGGLSASQLAWLDGQLAEADAAGQVAIVCGHHPLLPAESHQAWNADEVLAVIDRHPSLRAYFNGHNHTGAELVRNGVPFITFKSILQKPGITAYSVIRLFADRLEIEGQGREQSRTLALRPG